MSDRTQVNLYGRIFVRGDVRTVTGLHIGRGKEGLEIGGVDNPVVRDPLTNRPYIPGSSLKGKMRSLWEKMTGAEQKFPIGRIKGKEVFIHICEEEAKYQHCPVCPIYGVPGDKGSSNPTRLVVRDVLMSDAEADRLEEEAQTDLPFTEVKWEAAIDRVTSAAVPRPMERVPAGTCFEKMEIVFSVYEAEDLDRFVHVLEAMQLLQDDYLGGLGSRGSGKVVFERLSISTRSRKNYGHEANWQDMPQAVDGETQISLVLKTDNRTKLIAWLKEQIPFESYGS